MFKCKECNYVTKIKCNFNKHLKTAKHRNNVNNLTPNIDNIEQTYTFLPNLPNSLPNLPNSLPNLPNSAQNCPILPNSAHYCPILPNNDTFSESHDNSLENILICEYCDKEFKRRYHLTRHYKTCKSKMNQELNYKKLYEEILNEKAKSEKSKDSIISQLTDQLGRVLDKVGDTHITQNNIILNCYGNETIEHISDKQKLELLTLPYSMIPKLIKDVHFDPRCPENNNIYIPNKKEPYVKIFSGDKWEYRDRNTAISELIDKNYNRLDEFYQKQANQYMAIDQKNRYLEFQTQKESNNDELIKDVKKNVEIILINNKLVKND
jgi:hypothetical protein